MEKLIDKRMIVSLVIASVAIFFLQKWLTKKVTKPDGSVAHYVGNDQIGYM